MTQAIKYNSLINYKKGVLNSLSTSISAATQNECKTLSEGYAALSRPYASHIPPIVIELRPNLLAACCGFLMSFNNKSFQMVGISSPQYYFYTI